MGCILLRIRYLEADSLVLTSHLAHPASSLLNCDPVQMFCSLEFLSQYYLYNSMHHVWSFLNFRYMFAATPKPGDPSKEHW